MGIGAIMLVLGTAFGSVMFPVTKTQITTAFETITVNHTTTSPEKQYITITRTFTPSKGNTSTLTEWIAPIGYLVSIAYASGNCTIQAPTLSINFTTTETSIQPENLTGNYSLTITTMYEPPYWTSEEDNTSTVSWFLNCSITES